MSPIEKKLHDRSDSVCEISRETEDLVVYTVAPKTIESLENSIFIF
jgi:protein PhnA